MYLGVAALNWQHTIQCPLLLSWQILCSFTTSSLGCHLFLYNDQISLLFMQELTRIKDSMTTT